MSQTAISTWIVGIVVVVIVIAAAIGLWRVFRLQPLSNESRDRYARSWHAIEARFIEDPASAVQEADRLVVMVLTERGSKQPADLIKAREAAASNRGQSGTEGMRVAMVYYRRIVARSVGESRMKGAGSRREVAS